MSEQYSPPTTSSERLATALLVLRIVLGLFLLQWGIEKFVQPGTTVAIYQAFYSIPIAEGATWIIGIAECLLAIAVIIGLWRRISYGLAFLIHLVSVGSTWQQLIDPWGGPGNHLFTAGVPVLAAFWVLYYLRDSDRFSMDGRRASEDRSI